MRILTVCSELAPLAKRGGLADATQGLSQALSERGHDVRVLLPKYRESSPAVRRLRPAGGTQRYGFFEVERQTPGAQIYVVDGPAPAGEEIYAGDERDALRFLLLCDAALRLCETLAWAPQIVHCHDWHAAALTVMLSRARAEGRVSDRVRSVLTLHNIGYQGVFPVRVLAASGQTRLRGCFDRQDIARSTVNLLKAGIVHADALTTVSPTYAVEIQTVEYGMGLEALLAKRRADLTGILNGVDYRTWSPESDPYLQTHYGSDDPSPKQEIKAALCAHVGLAAAMTTPVLGLVSRLVAQKGIDLLIGALPALLRETDCVVALLGSGDPALMDALGAFAAERPERVAFAAGYDERLAHLILAGSDLIVIPSRYEPCGLTQLYALRYGTIPVVRATGGLADTVQHFDPVSGRGNGSVFRDADVEGLTWGIRSALEWFRDRALWSTLMGNAMDADFSWRRQVPHYEAVYRKVLDI